MMQIKIGELLRRYRLAASLTQPEVAARMAYSTSTISRLERDELPVRPEHIERFIAALYLPEADSQKIWAVYKHDQRAKHGLTDRSPAKISSTPQETSATLNPEETPPRAPDLQLINKRQPFIGKLTKRLAIVFTAATIVITGWFMLPHNMFGRRNPNVGWAVRAFESDDWSFVFVNDNLATTHENDKWVSIEPFLNRNDTPNYVTFVSLNGPVDGTWDFVISHNGKTVETYTGRTRKEFCVSYNHTARLFPNGTIAPVAIDEKEFPTNQWYARISADDFGFIWVNDLLATGAYSSRSGEFGWVAISHLFHDRETDEIRVGIWNFEGSHSYHIELCQDDKLVWTEKNNSYMAVHGKVFSKSFVESQFRSLGNCPMQIPPNFSYSALYIHSTD